MNEKDLVKGRYYNYTPENETPCLVVFEDYYKSVGAYKFIPHESENAYYITPEGLKNLHEIPFSEVPVELKGMRFNTNKRKWSLVDFASIEPMVEVLEFGAKKYTPDNWKKGLDKKEILESMMRHLTALMDGQPDDPESGIKS